MNTLHTYQYILHLLSVSLVVCKLLFPIKVFISLYSVVLTLLNCVFSLFDLNVDA